mmetsp:Transcript_12613/g.35607  ORF Transcript_12613/g.35607 Transcript_12613/m.35607 type:complete len:228 (-) Transcript_12613:148-831(-)
MIHWEEAHRTTLTVSELRQRREGRLVLARPPNEHCCLGLSGRSQRAELEVGCLPHPCSGRAWPVCCSATVTTVATVTRFPVCLSRVASHRLLKKQRRGKRGNKESPRSHDKHLVGQQALVFGHPCDQIPQFPSANHCSPQRHAFPKRQVASESRDCDLAQNCTDDAKQGPVHKRGALEKLLNRNCERYDGPEEEPNQEPCEALHLTIPRQRCGRSPDKPRPSGECPE